MKTIIFNPRQKSGPPKQSTILGSSAPSASLPNRIMAPHVAQVRPGAAHRPPRVHSLAIRARAIANVSPQHLFPGLQIRLLPPALWHALVGATKLTEAGLRSGAAWPGTAGKRPPLETLSGPRRSSLSSRSSGKPTPTRGQSCSAWQRCLSRRTTGRPTPSAPSSSSLSR